MCWNFFREPFFLQALLAVVLLCLFGCGVDGALVYAEVEFNGCEAVCTGLEMRRSLTPGPLPGQHCSDLHVMFFGEAFGVWAQKNASYDVFWAYSGARNEVFVSASGDGVHWRSATGSGEFAVCTTLEEEDGVDFQLCLGFNGTVSQQGNAVKDAYAVAALRAVKGPNSQFFYEEYGPQFSKTCPSYRWAIITGAALLLLALCCLCFCVARCCCSRPTTPPPVYTASLNNGYVPPRPSAPPATVVESREWK